MYRSVYIWVRVRLGRGWGRGVGGEQEWRGACVGLCGQKCACICVCAWLHYVIRQKLAPMYVSVFKYRIRLKMSKKPKTWILTLKLNIDIITVKLNQIRLGKRLQRVKDSWSTLSGIMRDIHGCHLVRNNCHSVHKQAALIQTSFFPNWKKNNRFLWRANLLKDSRPYSFWASGEDQTTQ